MTSQQIEALVRLMRAIAVEEARAMTHQPVPAANARDAQNEFEVAMGCVE